MSSARRFMPIRKARITFNERGLDTGAADSHDEVKVDTKTSELERLAITLGGIIRWSDRGRMDKNSRDARHVDLENPSNIRTSNEDQGADHRDSAKAVDPLIERLNELDTRPPLTSMHG